MRRVSDINFWGSAARTAACAARSSVALALAAGLISACNGSGGFGGGAKKVQNLPTKTAPAPAPVVQPQAQPTLPEVAPTPTQPDVAPPPVTPAVQPVSPTPPLVTPIPVPPAPPPAPRPQPQPQPQPPVKPPVAPLPPAPPSAPQPSNEQGELRFKAVPFVNMEHQAHATEPGSFAILKDGSGKVVAAGPMTPEAACRGDNIESMAYPVVELSVPLTYIAGASQAGGGGGSGTLSVCIVSNPSASGDALTCQKVDRGNDPDRPAFWYDRPVQYTVSGTSVKITNTAGYGNGGGGGGAPDQSGGPSNGGGTPSGGGSAPSVTPDPTQTAGDPSVGGDFGLKLTEEVQGGLSFAHPIQGPICGSKARGYADYNSPLVLDLDHDGKLALTNVWSKDPRVPVVSFDVEGKGTKIRTGWVQPSDGLLVLDVDGNGKIDSGAELFGENSFRPDAKDKWAYTNFENGFQALAQYDTNQDGVIDDKDAVFSKLKVWRDLNQDGVSQPNELTSLAEAGVKSISLAYAKTGSPGHYQMAAMNEIRLQAEYTATDGKTYKIGDVWFAARRGAVAAKEGGK